MLQFNRDRRAVAAEIRSADWSISEVEKAVADLDRVPFEGTGYVLTHLSAARQRLGLNSIMWLQDDVTAPALSPSPTLPDFTPPPAAIRNAAYSDDVGSVIMCRAQDNGALLAAIRSEIATLKSARAAILSQFDIAL